MQLLIQGIVFFVVFGLLWYVVQTKNILGLGVRIKGGKEAALNTLLTIMYCYCSICGVALFYRPVIAAAKAGCAI